MIERHITFNMHPDRGPDFERFFADRYRPPVSGFPGFVSVSLLREEGSDLRYVMTFRWESAEAAAGWRTSAEHEALQPEFVAHFSSMDIVVYDVVG